MKKLSEILLLLLTISGNVFADDHGLNFSGFGTLGAAYFSGQDADYVTSQPSGPGRSQSVGYGLDSVLAGQVDGKLASDFNYTVQGITLYKPDNTWDPFFRIANVRYKPDDDFQVRAGLLPNTSGLVSEYRRMNFGNIWPRPPVEVYGLLSSSDAVLAGMDMDITTHHNYGTLHWDISYSKIESHNARSNQSGEDPLTSRPLTINLTWEVGDWKNRLSTTPWGNSTFVGATQQPVLAAIRQADPSRASQFGNDGRYTLILLSSSYDSEEWVFMSEWILRREFDVWFIDQEAAYATLGHRFGNALPYVTIARRLSLMNLERYQGSPAYAMISALTLAQNASQSSISFGLTYDLMPKVKLKTQLDVISPDAGSAGVLFNLSPTYNRANPPVYQMFSTSVDFIF